MKSNLHNTLAHKVDILANRTLKQEVRYLNIRLTILHFAIAITFFLAHLPSSVYAQFVVVYRVGDGGSGGSGGGNVSSQGASGPAKLVPLIVLPVTPQTLQGITNRIQIAANKITFNIDKFDYNSVEALKVVDKMRIDSLNAAKYPKAMQDFQEALAKFKSLEPVSNHIHETLEKGGHIATILEATRDDLALQEKTIAEANSLCQRGNRIIEFGKTWRQSTTSASQNSLTELAFSKEDKQKILKAHQDISSAQIRLAELNKNRKELLDKTSLVRSEALQLAGTIALALKIPVSTMQSYLGVLNNNIGVRTAIDFSEAYVTTLIKENIEKDVPITNALKTAFAQATAKAIISTASVHELRLSDFAVLPSKVLAFADDLAFAESLLSEPKKFTRMVNENLEQMNLLTKRYNQIINKSNVDAKIVIDKACKKFLTQPY